jgi:hypothetical protein
MADLRVGTRPATSTQLVTDQDGYFAATELRPGYYLIRIGPERGSPEILRQFLAEDLDVVDNDLKRRSGPAVVT